MSNTLAKLGYHEVAHQRIGQQTNHQKPHVKTINYQGLTRASHTQFGRVMIKWELSQDSNHELSTLSHEVAVLTAVSHFQSTEAQNIPQAIAPPILAYETMCVEVLEQYWQLSILAMAYYENGNLAQQLSNEKSSLLSDEKKYQIINQVAHLIASLHEASWLHNDIKPSNILLEISFDNAFPNNADNSSLMPSLLLTDFALAENVDSSFHNHRYSFPK